MMATVLRSTRGWSRAWIDARLVVASGWRYDAGETCSWELLVAFPIETERLSIRPFTLDDAEEIHAIWSDPEAMHWIPSGTLSSVQATREKIGRFMAHQDAHGFSLWPVRERSTGRIVGDCGLLLVERS